MKVVHPLDPIYNQESKVLILGSFPSVKSRENNFYYANPRNRFWPTLEKIFHEKIEANTEARKLFLLKHKIAIFDVVKECDIKSSSDSSIKNVVPNDIKKIILNSNIKAIFTTGTKAYDLYNKYIYIFKTILCSKRKCRFSNILRRCSSNGIIYWKSIIWKK